MVDRSLLRVLNQRGYQLLRFHNIYAQALRPGDATGTAPAARSRAVEVHTVDASTALAWSTTVLDGFGSTRDTDRDRVETWNRMVRALPGVTALVAVMDGQPVGAASVMVLGATAMLGGAATLPAFRRRGVQRTLIEARLAVADTPDVPWRSSPPIPAAARAATPSAPGPSSSATMSACVCPWSRRPIGASSPGQDASSASRRIPRSRRQDTTLQGAPRAERGPMQGRVGLLLDGGEVIEEQTEHILDHGLAGRGPPPPISPKRAPQMGISRLPWAGMMVRPSIAAVISATGNSPSCRCAIRVRSAGGGWSVGAAGPSPRPCVPWQALQWRTNTYGASLMAPLGNCRGPLCCRQGHPQEDPPHHNHTEPILLHTRSPIRRPLCLMDVGLLLCVPCLAPPTVVRGSTGSSPCTGPLGVRIGGVVIRSSA